MTSSNEEDDWVIRYREQATEFMTKVGRLRRGDPGVSLSSLREELKKLFDAAEDEGYGAMYDSDHQ